jgi:hypothetical protein
MTACPTWIVNVAGLNMKSLMVTFECWTVKRSWSGLAKARGPTRTVSTPLNAFRIVLAGMATSISMVYGRPAVMVAKVLGVMLVVLFSEGVRRRVTLVIVMVLVNVTVVENIAPGVKVAVTGCRDHVILAGGPLLAKAVGGTFTSNSVRIAITAMPNAASKRSLFRVSRTSLKELTYEARFPHPYLT